MIIYKTINSLTGTIYVGKACGRNITKAYFGSGTYLKRAIKKYGEKKFNRVTIDEAENREAQNLKEKFWISFYRDCGFALYNIAPGGEGGCGKHSEETKRKIGLAHIGRRHSEETKQKLSLSHMGQINLNAIVAMAAARDGVSRSKETRLKISSSLKGKPSNNKGKHSKYRGKTWIVENGKRLWKEVELR